MTNIPQPLEVKTDCLVEMLKTHSSRIPLLSRWSWKPVCLKKPDGVCSLDEASQFVRVMSNSHVDNLSERPLHYLLTEQRTNSRGQAIYSFRDFPAPDSTAARDSSYGERYVHVRLTPKLSLK